MTHRDYTMTDALMFAGGGILGAGLALLFAPRSGRESRGEIVRLARTTGEKADRIVRGFAEDVGDRAESAGKKASRMWCSGRNRLESHGHRVAQWIGGCSK